MFCSRSSCSPRRSGTYAREWDPVGLFSEIFVPALKGFETTTVETGLRGFWLRGDSFPGIKGETPSAYGIRLAVTIHDEGPAGTLSRREKGTRWLLFTIRHPAAKILRGFVTGNCLSLRSGGEKRDRESDSRADRRSGENRESGRLARVPSGFLTKKLPTYLEVAGKRVFLGNEH